MQTENQRPTYTSSDPSDRGALVVLFLLLLGLFLRSLREGWVLFANDAPLGTLEAYYPFTLGFFSGAWHHLQWLGMPAPSALPNLSYGFMLLMGPTLYSKFFVPAALVALGGAAWMFFRAQGFTWWVCLLGAVAASLNSDAFSHACWGLPSVTMGMAMTFLALAFAARVPASTRTAWMLWPLAGFAIGLAVMESYDVGAILSLYVAAFVLFQSLNGDGKPGMRVAKGVGGIVLMAAAAVFISAQALSTLVGTQVKGVSGMAQDDSTRAQRWREATQWSLPKTETLQLVVPGLFGYRMDTPDGGWYWGGVGRDPAWDVYLAKPNPDPAAAPAGALMRHSGAGFYAGTLVVLVAVWGFVNSWRRTGNPYQAHERRLIWFWAGAALISLLLAYGRHAPFYQIVYQLPFFSTIRNPIKFLHPLQISLIILFGYGLQGLWRGYLEPARRLRPAFGEQIRHWWRAAMPADRRWVLASVTVVFLAGFAWLLYSSSTASMVAQLGRVGFGDPPGLAEEIARFSAGQAGVAFLFLSASVAAVFLIMSGMWSGRARRWAGVFLGVILVGDLARANLPWIVYYDYREKYESNAVIELLRQDPWQHRVTGRMMPMGGGPLVNDQGLVFASLYNEWLEHLFQYYSVQSLDVVQMPRVPLLDKAYLQAFHPANTNEFRKLGRLWELTNTRYVLGMTGFLDFLNQQLDVGEDRFRVHTAFTVLPKPGVEQVARLSQLTVAPATNGPFALFEFEGALPRVSLMSRWEVVTNDTACLERLVDPRFNPREIVLVNDAVAEPAASAIAGSGGSTAIEHYEPKRIVVKATVTAPSVLLVNDRHHVDWKVYVNGQRRDLLRCNHIMRGVRLEPGEQSVEFRFEPAVTALYVSLAALVVGLVLLSCLIVMAPRDSQPLGAAEIARDEPAPRVPRRP